jgi:hypothetical protein
MPVPSMFDPGQLAGPLQEFIKRIARGIGILYEPTKIVRKAKAEAEAKIILSKADLAVSDIRSRAKLRKEYLSSRQQVNLENVIKLALPLVDQNKVPGDMDEDWLIQFMNNAQDVSDIEMQNLWSKILAGEYNASGSFSKRTMNTVQMLRKSEADLITTFYSLVSILDNDLYAAIRIKPGKLEAFQVTDLMLGQLKDIGIISETMHFILPNKSVRHRMDYFGKVLYFYKSDRVQYEPAVVFYNLSAIGKELFRVASPVANENYFASLRRYFEADGIDIDEH